MSKYVSKLQNKRVLVIGGTSGIGFCVAEAAIEHGAIVVVASSRQSSIDSSIERFHKSYPSAQVSGFPCDLADPSALEDNLKALFDFATKEGKLDHIVLTAAPAIDMQKLENVTAERYQSMLQIRLVGAILLAKTSLSYLNISNSSSLTLTGGVNTYKPAPGWSMAAGAGGGAEGLVRGLAVDMKPVRVNLVAPGAVLTELWTRTFKSPEEMDKIKEMYKSKALVGEIGAPEDVAEAYIYLMKDKFVDGQVLLSEGGYLLM